MLSESQKSAARFHGSETLTKRRSRLRSLKTSLGELRGESNLAAADKKAIEEGMRALDRILFAMNTDIDVAKRIKRDWDKRVHNATEALHALPLSGVADVVALAELDHSLGRPAALIEDTEHYGWARIAKERVREAIAGLAHRCANEGKPPAEFVQYVRAAMPHAAAKHAELIQRINTMAVAQAIERANHHPGGAL